MSTPNKLRLHKGPRQSKHIAGGEDGQRDICADQHGNFSKQTHPQRLFAFPPRSWFGSFPKATSSTSKACSHGYTTTSITSGPRCVIALANWGRELLNRGCAARLDAHAESKLDPIKFGIMHIEHRKGLGPGTAGSDARKVDVEDRENIVKAMLERQ
jgi:hypothetical protein